MYIKLSILLMAVLLICMKRLKIHVSAVQFRPEPPSSPETSPLGLFLFAYFRLATYGQVSEL